MSWIYGSETITRSDQFPSWAIGFVYMITNLDTNRSYIGRKTFRSRRKRNFGKREVAAMKDKRLKKYEYVEKEVKGWVEYTGSCDELNEHVARGDRIRKVILSLCATRKEISYRETEALFSHSVLESDRWYNRNIMSKFFSADIERAKEIKYGSRA